MDNLPMLLPNPVCSNHVIPTPFTPGSISTNNKDYTDYETTDTAATDGVVFDDREQIEETLRTGPQEPAREEMAPHKDGPAPSRWTLRSIRVSVPSLAHYSLSGVWRVLQRLELKLRSSRVQQFSPDPFYLEKYDYLDQCLRQTRAQSHRVVTVFLDEMGYYRWPEEAVDWSGVGGVVADRCGSKEQQWRIIGALNALTGQVDYLDGYVCGRAKVIDMYKHLVQAYPQAELLYVVQETWSIHRHPEVLEALEQWPHVEPVWLPTYAPWLNPIEKLWRWLRQDVLKLHRLAGDWKALQSRVCQFLDQFCHGSQALLEYVGLTGEGKLARALRG
jgi:transposase